MTVFTDVQVRTASQRDSVRDQTRVCNINLGTAVNT